MRTALICLVAVVGSLFLSECSGQLFMRGGVIHEWERWRSVASAATPIFPLPDHALVDIDLVAHSWDFWDAVMKECKDWGYHCVLDPWREQVEAWVECCACVEKKGPGKVIPAGTPVGCAVPETTIPAIRFSSSGGQCGNCEELPWYVRDGQDPKRQVQVKVSRKPVKAESKND